MFIYPALVVVWAIGFIISFLYMAYTDRSDVLLEKEERLSWLDLTFYAAIWPLLTSLWLLAKLFAGVRAAREWLLP